jgi:hypothetical protein
VILGPSAFHFETNISVCNAGIVVLPVFWPKCDSREVSELAEEGGEPYSDEVAWCNAKLCANLKGAAAFSTKCSLALRPLKTGSGSAI